jgi:hypothetical protein
MKDRFYKLSTSFVFRPVWVSNDASSVDRLVRIEQARNHKTGIPLLDIAGEGLPTLRIK